MELFKAHNQWKTRPQDERFKSVVALHSACSAHRRVAVEADVSYKNLRVEAQGEEINLVGKAGTPAKLSHWAMGQLCQRAGAPASYLRELPATLAAQNLNHGLKARSDESPNDSAKLMLHQNGGYTLRAVTGENYSRIWNADVTERLVRLQEANPNWQNPKAYKILSPAKNGGWPALTGELEPAGLYASDHDMFAFLVDESKTIEGSPKGLNRGFFVWNSEVGASSFGVMTFLYDRVCGNNIVWGASNVTEMRIRHVGNADTRAFHQLGVELKRYADSSTSEVEAQIAYARKYQLGATKEQALDGLMNAIGKLKLTNISRGRAEDALSLAEKREDRYGNPYSLWGAIGGLTEASQSIPHMDTRMKIERDAGKLMKVAF
jgi:hypothetical protein